MRTTVEPKVASPRRGEGKRRFPRPTALQEVAVFPLDDDLVLCHGGTGEIFMLNRTGARIWERCDGSRTIREIAREMATSYAIGYRQALADVRELVSRLRAANLVVMQ